MNTRKVDKREQHVRKKLTAAILMLLISCIMTVTSTYAWFTLSTAPEVTGIQTTIGGNGNLEIALATGDTWEHSTDPTMFTNGMIDVNDDGVQDIRDTNITWGNLVDVGIGDSGIDYYGLNNIKLYPSRISLGDDGKVKTNLISVPTYSSDGRISDLSDTNTVSGSYVYEGTSSYFGTDGLGVRAIGVSAGLSTRQINFRNAKSTLNSEIGSSENSILLSLNQEDGGTLAGIAIEHGMGGKSESYTETDVIAIGNLITGLENALVDIEDAIFATIDGYVSSKAGQAAEGESSGNGKFTDADYKLFADVLSSIASSENAIDAIKVNSNEITITLDGYDGPSSFTNADLASTITTYKNILSIVQTARTKYSEITPVPNLNDDVEQEYTWTDISDSMSVLISTTGIRANGMTIEEIKADTGGFASKVMSSGGVIVTLSAGSGVYYDIASMIGNFSSKIIIPLIEYGGMKMEDVTATINTGFEGTAKLKAHYAAIMQLEGPDNLDTTEVQKITDVYAYAIDLYLRTNASDATLMLSDAVQRIYSDSNNEETQGKGSNMTFSSTNPGFSTDNMKSLMSAIKITFMKPDGTIVKNACLDVENAVVIGEQITAKIKTMETTIVGEGDTAVEKIVLSDEIMKLEQNTVTGLTVLVYLDGDKVTNADVANGASSMTGTMNLQFKTDATLVPMEYKDLHMTDESVTPTDDPQGH